MLWLLGMLQSCHRDPPPRAAHPLPALGLQAIARDPVQVAFGPPLPADGYQVLPLRLSLNAAFELPGVLFLPAGPGPHPAVLLAHGHFGEGKASGEVQGPAHAFAANGYAVLALDTPGVEEGERPDRALHFAEGGANRLRLARSGSSAMAVQVAGLQAGLDYLQQRGDIGRVAVSGASGGAVQALYLALVDARPVAAVFSSPVGVPHAPQDGGCLCDVVDPAITEAELLSSLDLPSLWMVEDERGAPAGLPRGAEWRSVPGPHGYTEAMIQQALDFLAPLLGGGTLLPNPLPHSPASALQGPAPKGNLRQLVSTQPAGPSVVEVPLTLQCEPGKGKRIAVLGVDADLPEGLRACAVTFSEEGPIEARVLQARASGSASLGVALKESGVEGILARGAYGPAALESGLPAGILEMPSTSEGLLWYTEGDWEGRDCVGCVDSVEAALARLAEGLAEAPAERPAD